MSLFKIGQLSQQTGVGIEALRFYEKQELLIAVGRLSSGYRLYDQDSVKRVRFIRSAKKLGFSLKEIKELLSLKIAPDTTCADIEKVAANKLAEVRDKIQLLQRMEQILQEFLSMCHANEVDDDCPLFEALDDESLLAR